MRIDILSKTPYPWNYDFHAGKELQRALQKLKVDARLLINGPDVLTNILSHSPDFILTFGHWGFQDADLLLCDFLNTHQVVWAKGYVGEALVYLKSPNGKVVCSDKGIVTKIQQENLLFLPHGIAEKWNRSPEDVRGYEIVMIADLVDRALIRAQWHEERSKKECLLLEKAIQFAEEREATHAIEILAKMGNARGYTHEVILELEAYLKAKRVQEMVESVVGARIDLFGNHQGGDWLLRLKNKERVFLHAALPFQEVMILFSRAKIVLIDGHEIVDGLPFWFLQALCCGALPIVGEMPFLRESFDAPLYYKKGHWREMSERVDYFLREEIRRREIVFALQEALSGHSWEVRASSLCEQLMRAVR